MGKFHERPWVRVELGEGSGVKTNHSLQAGFCDPAGKRDQRGGRGREGPGGRCSWEATTRREEGDRVRKGQRYERQREETEMGRQRQKDAQTDRDRDRKGEKGAGRKGPGV